MGSLRTDPRLETSFSKGFSRAGPPSPPLPPEDVDRNILRNLVGL